MGYLIHNSYLLNVLTIKLKYFEKTFLVVFSTTTFWQLKRISCENTVDKNQNAPSEIISKYVLTHFAIQSTNF